MAPLAFYYGSGSPFAWRVGLALDHKGGIPCEMKTLSFNKGEHKRQRVSPPKLGNLWRVPVFLSLKGLLQ